MVNNYGIIIRSLWVITLINLCGVISLGMIAVTLVGAERNVINAIF